jgi:hypothetical protein
MRDLPSSYLLKHMSIYLEDIKDIARHTVYLQSDISATINLFKESSPLSSVHVYGFIMNEMSRVPSTFPLVLYHSRAL